MEQEPGTSIGGAAGALALVAVGALASLPLIAARKVLPPTAVALPVAAGAATGAAVLARRALEQLKEAAPAQVEERIQAAQEDLAQTLKREARQAL